MAQTYNYIKKQASDFLEQWLGDMDSLKEMYGDSANMIDSLGSINEQLAAEYDNYTEMFSPYRDQLLELASADYDRRAELSDQFMDLATADYQGASNRAVADASIQSNIARKGLTRDLARRGTTSGARVENEMRKSYLDEARTRTLASTTAQQNEKTRALSAAATGVEMFDPTQSISTAAQIQTGANDLLTAQGDLSATQASLNTDLANSYSQNVTNELGEAAGTYEGMRIAEGIKRDASLAEAWEKDRQSALIASTWYDVDVPGDGRRTANPYL